MKRALMVFGLGLLMMACAGTKLKIDRPLVEKSNVPYFYTLQSDVEVTPQGLAVLNAKLVKKFAQQPNSVNDNGNRKVEITITEYRVRHGAARALVGIMAGTDNVVSRVKVMEASSGAVLAEFTVKTLNDSAWWSTEGMLEDHVNKIATYIYSGKS